MQVSFYFILYTENFENNISRERVGVGFKLIFAMLLTWFSWKPVLIKWRWKINGKNFTESRASTQLRERKGQI